jgi:hypothetical protein
MGCTLNLVLNIPAKVWNEAALAGDGTPGLRLREIASEKVKDRG